MRLCNWQILVLIEVQPVIVDWWLLRGLALHIFKIFFVRFCSKSQVLDVATEVVVPRKRCSFVSLQFYKLFFRYFRPNFIRQNSHALFVFADELGSAKDFPHDLLLINIIEVGGRVPGINDWIRTWNIVVRHLIFKEEGSKDYALPKALFVNGLVNFGHFIYDCWIRQLSLFFERPFMHLLQHDFQNRFLLDRYVFFAVAFNITDLSNPVYLLGRKLKLNKADFELFLNVFVVWFS